MKKVLLTISILSLGNIFSGTMAANFYQAPNAGNLNFYPMMQHQMEKQETLDFVNNPEAYKEKREAKDAQLDYIEGKTNFNPSYKPTSFNLNSTRDNNIQELPEPKKMEFSKDGNGQIIIKGVQ